MERELTIFTWRCYDVVDPYGPQQPRRIEAVVLTLVWMALPVSVDVLKHRSSVRGVERWQANSTAYSVTRAS